MKIFIIFLGLSVTISSFANDVYYKIEANDQLGVVFLSIGHNRLWQKDGKVNLFKKNFKKKNLDLFYPGSFIKLREEDILFKKNVVFSRKFFKIIKKAKKQNEYDELLRDENLNEETISNAPVPEVLILTTEKLKSSKQAPPIQELIQSFNLYPGVGLFIARDSESDRAVSTSTLTGIQPLVQFKGIYSTSLFGSICVDILAKKIINDKFSFPVNTDYRVQLVPKWNFTDNFRFSFSHSIISHSYVGKSTDTEIAYKLKSNFIGFGFVVPREVFWLEFFIEKAYSGETQSTESTQSASKGFRLDSEIVYPISKNWRILPGINYYHLKQNSAEYSLSVVELRTVFARDFDF